MYVCCLCTLAPCLCYMPLVFALKPPCLCLYSPGLRTRHALGLCIHVPGLCTNAPAPGLCLCAPFFVSIYLRLSSYPCVSLHALEINQMFPVHKQNQWIVKNEIQNPPNCKIIDQHSRNWSSQACQVEKSRRKKNLRLDFTGFAKCRCVHFKGISTFTIRKSMFVLCGIVNMQV